VSWSEHLRAEIAFEFHRFSTWERIEQNAILDHHHGRTQASYERRRKHGPKGLRKAYDADRQAASSAANIEAARAAGDMKRVRFLESCKRAKQRKATKS